MGFAILPNHSGNLSNDIKGVWWLLTREDYTKDGEKRIDPVLGTDPIGILSYSGSHFAAQFMKRDRSAVVTEATYTGHNNTAAFGGYDAYFGTYEVNEATGKVTHTLIGSVTPSNIGMVVHRDMRVDNNELIIQLETTTVADEPIIRTLTWKRINQ